MTHTIAWTDGTTWTADEPTFRRVTERLDAARASIAGLDPIYSNFKTLSARGERIDVDTLAPTEDDRAILTAALERAVEEARDLGPAGLRFDDPADYEAFIARLRQLHELFVTDVTHKVR